jgi:hypothetical protein
MAARLFIARLTEGAKDAQNMGKLDETGAKALYLIRIRGMLDEDWSDWLGGVEMAPEQAVDGSPITLLTGCFDHSALHGALAKLRDLNLTLISVARLESDDRQGGE